MNIELIDHKAELLTPAEWLVEYPKLVELAGRTCYKSEDKITEDSAEQFVKMLVMLGHESVLEHLSLTFKLTTSRSVTHQLVRHRLGSYSQESQRYCNYQKKGGKIIKDAGRLGIDALNYMRKSFQMYDRLVVEGAKPEEARAVLPNCAATDIVVTYNLRQWRYVLKHRLENTRAQHDMRYLMNLVLDEIKKYEGLKVFFQDIKGL